MKGIFLGVAILTLLIFTGCGSSNRDSNISDGNNSSSDMLTMLPPIPIYSSHSINSSSWMANIKDDVSIADITIPGTHDSAASDAYGYEAISGKSYIIAQSESITSQLKLGVRFFDLRIYYNDDDVLQITHDIYNIKKTFDGVLREIKIFLNEHQTETAILLLKQEDSTLSDTTFSGHIYNALKKQGLDNDNFYVEDGSLPTIGEVRGKMVIFRRFGLGSFNKKLGHYIKIPNMDKGSYHQGSNYKYFTQDHYTVDQGEHHESNYWYKALLIKDAINKAHDDDDTKGRLYLNYVSANDLGLNDTLRDVAQYLNAKTDTFVKDRVGQGKAGVILINFAGTTGDDLTPNLVKHIIDVNNFDFSPWTKEKLISSNIGTSTQGGGITMGDIRGDGTNRLISFYIDDPKGENKATFYVSNAVINGSIDGWEASSYLIPGHFGSENSGAGITIGDIDNDGLNEMVVFFIDQIKNGENKAYYMVGSNFNKKTTINNMSNIYIPTWKKRINIDAHFGVYTSGAGITMGDIDGDGRQNLIIFYIDNPDGENKGYYRVSSNLNADGTIEPDQNNKSWSERMPITYKDGTSHFGGENSGAGITIGDIDNDGGQNLIISFIDNPTGVNKSFYMISSNINSDGTVDSWSKRKQIYGWTGTESSGAGITIGNMNSGSTIKDLIFYFIDNPNGENANYYKIGLNKVANHPL